MMIYKKRFSENDSHITNDVLPDEDTAQKMFYTIQAGSEVTFLDKTGKKRTELAVEYFPKSFVWTTKENEPIMIENIISVKK